MDDPRKTSEDTTAVNDGEEVDLPPDLAMTDWRSALPATSVWSSLSSVATAG
jgi:hypothetical protein